LSLGSSVRRGSLDGSGAGDDEASDQRVPMAFDIDWQTAATHPVSYLILHSAYRTNKIVLIKQKIALAFRLLVWVAVRRELEATPDALSFSPRHHKVGI
jgi:hypothetical protein